MRVRLYLSPRKEEKNKLYEIKIKKVIMKRKILQTLWVAILLLTACTQEELPMSGTSDGITFAITVTDNGYALTTSADGSQKADTRATEDGYRTEFTNGDACGLYLVRNGEIVYDNVKLTATAGTDGSLTWQPETGNPLTGGMMNEYYFIYYPYQEDMTGKVTASATDDAGFFTQLINNWQPKADQSDYMQGYTVSDLMTAKGMASKADGKLSLNFAMTHRMALAVIEMPKTVYHFTNTTGGSIPDYTVLTAVDFTAEANPYRSSDGTYRYIVNPAAQPVSLTGSYDDGNKKFTVTTQGIATSSYKTYKVDGAKTDEKSHTLQVGDYLLNDGTLIGKNESLTEEQKSSVSAIVFWTPSETTVDGRATPASLTDDKIMAAEHPDCTHGLAVAVKKVTYNGTEDIVWQDPYESVKDWQAGVDDYKPKSSNFVFVASNYGATDNINRIYGYQNTIVLRAYNAHCIANGKQSYIVRPVAALDEFKKSNPAPENSTGWFLPSLKELHMLYYKDVDDIWNQDHKTATYDIVNSSLSATGGDNLFPFFHWSSSERQGMSEGAYGFSFDGGWSSTIIKNSTSKVRIVCAF